MRSFRLESFVPAAVEVPLETAIDLDKSFDVPVVSCYAGQAERSQIILWVVIHRKKPEGGSNLR